MSHREVLEALSGLLLAMFVAMLSSTVVTNALPRIVTDLHGSQTGYTWIVVATLLAMTASTPIWGKLADQFSKKLLVQSALVIYTVGSLIAALAPNMTCPDRRARRPGPRRRWPHRAGAGRHRLDGESARARPLRRLHRRDVRAGHRLRSAHRRPDRRLPARLARHLLRRPPIAVAAFIVLQPKLHLPVVKRPVQIDYLGATLIVGGVSILLVWVSLAGQQFGWTSATSATMVVAGLAVIAAALYVEARVAVEPIIPLRLFKDRTTSLATGASVLIGFAMFGATVYLSEYFQNARGMTPTEAGLMSVAMVGGLLVSSIVTGRIISDTGLWKRYLVGGMVLVVVGITLLGTIDATTPLVEVGAFMALLGLGLGATMQNLVLAVQNNTAQADMGAASSVVSFFRSMGGSIGVSALGAVLSHQVTQKVTDGLAALGIEGGHSTGTIPDLATLPAPVRAIYETAFGEATGHLFMVAAPFALLAFVCILFIREVPLRTTLDHEQAAIGNNDPVQAEGRTEAGVR